VEVIAARSWPKKPPTLVGPGDRSSVDRHEVAGDVRTVGTAPEHLAFMGEVS
jgi:hypothetical protein